MDAAEFAAGAAVWLLPVGTVGYGDLICFAAVVSAAAAWCEGVCACVLSLQALRVYQQHSIVSMLFHQTRTLLQAALTVP